MVNGDDCLLYVDEKGKQAWERIASSAGMESSVGKTYYHGKFAQMNSVNYYWRDEFVECPYVNCSLLNKELAKGGEKRHYSGLGSLSRQFRDRSWFKGASRIFIARHRKGLLSDAPPWISWYVPECLGGLGIVPPAGPVRMTFGQRRLASWLWTRCELGEPYSSGKAPQKIPGWLEDAMRRAQQYKIRQDELSEAENSWDQSWQKPNYNGFCLDEFEKSFALENPGGVLSPQGLDTDVSLGTWMRRWKEAANKFDSSERFVLQGESDILAYTPPKFDIPEHIGRFFLEARSFDFSSLFQHLEREAIYKYLGLHPSSRKTLSQMNPSG